MSSYTYPVARPTGALTTAQIHLLLQNPSLIGKRLAELMDQRFIADFLLSGRYNATGGGIFYETGEEIFAADSPEAVEAGSEYPLTVLTRGEIAAAKTVKWGIDTEITDENIARLGQPIVDRALLRLANSVIKNVDSVAWAVIASKVTQTSAASGNWTTTKAVITSALLTKSRAEDLGLGINLDTVALLGEDYATVMGLFLDSGLLPKENANAILTGELPANVMGLDWVTSTSVSGTDPWMFDRTQLGGMADENLGGPGYVRAGDFGVETKVIRKDDDDKYRPRARRVTVPIVTESKAGFKITGTGL